MSTQFCLVPKKCTYFNLLCAWKHYNKNKRKKENSLLCWLFRCKLLHDPASRYNNSTNQLFLDGFDNLFLFHVKLVAVALFRKDSEVDTIHPLPLSVVTNKQRPCVDVIVPWMTETQKDPAYTLLTEG